MRFWSLIWTGCAFIAGFLAAWALKNPREARASSPQFRSSIRADLPPAGAERPQPQRTENMAEDRESTVAPAKPPSRGKWQVAVDLLKDGVVPRNSVRAFGNDGKLSPNLIALLEMTPLEAEQLQARLDAALREVQQMEVHAATFAQTEKGLSISIQPFAGAGAAVYDHLDSDIAAQLGHDRAAAFTALAGDQLEQRFDQFGAVERHLEIARVSGDASGAYSLIDTSETGPGQRHELRRTLANADEALAAIGVIGVRAREFFGDTHVVAPDARP